MKPGDQLKDEHRTIGRVIKSLQNTARALDSGIPVNGEILADEVDFLRNFVDACHHRKEEVVLFPVIEHELPTLAHDPVPRLIREHEHGREMLRSIDEAISLFAAGDRDQAPSIANMYRGYASMLIEHIKTENTELLKIINEQIPADKKLEIAERFEQIEDELGPDYHERYLKLAAALYDAGQKMVA